MRPYRITGCVLVGFICLMVGMAHADEPGRPRIDQIFSPEKEARINQLAGYSLEDAWEGLKSDDFISEEDYLNKAVHVAFAAKSGDAVEMALRYVRSGSVQKDAEGARNLYMARKICEVFPDEALEPLLDLYNNGGPKIRKNVIYVLGQLAGGEPVRALLVHALDDTAYCEDVSDESVGDPLRVCDVAYNQLIIRYNIQDVLRVIGTLHKLEVRDFHIQKLRDSKV